MNEDRLFLRAPEVGTNLCPGYAHFGKAQRLAPAHAVRVINLPSGHWLVARFAQNVGSYLYVVQGEVFPVYCDPIPLSGHGLGMPALPTQLQFNLGPENER
jgi:hypothetical protein